MQSHDPHEPISDVPDYAAALSVVETVSAKPAHEVVLTETEAKRTDFAAIYEDIKAKLDAAESGKTADAIDAVRKQYEADNASLIGKHFARVLLDAPTWDKKNIELQVMKNSRESAARAQGVENLPKSASETALKLEVIQYNHDLRELFEAKHEGFTTAELTKWYGAFLGEKMQTAAREVSGVVAEIALRKVLSGADFLQAIEYGSVEEDAKGRDIIGLIKNGEELISLTADSKAGGQDTEIKVDRKMGIKIIMGVDLGRLDAYGDIDDAYAAELVFKAGLALQKAVVERASKMTERKAQ